MRPIDRVLAALASQGPVRSESNALQWTCFCPAHDDQQTRSLAVAVGSDGERVVLTCYANCDPRDVLRRVGLDWADLYPEDRVLTVAEIAQAKALPAGWLIDKIGLRDVPGQGVGIPYYDQDGKFLLLRRRKSLGQRPRQPKGKSLQLYGLWRLKDARKAGSLVLVEGESDCWALWHHGFPAAGLPGAAATKVLTADTLQGIGRLYIWQEPGEAGASMVEKVARKLKQLSWHGEARVIRHQSHKDPADWHVREGSALADGLRGLMAEAAPLPEPGQRGRPRRPVSVPGIIGRAAAAAGLSPGRNGPPGAGNGASGDGGGLNGPPVSPSEPASIPGPSPGYFGLTDLGNAQRLVYRHGRDLRYCHPWRKWMIWRGNCWREDTTGEIWRRMADTVCAIYAEAYATSQPDLRGQLLEHAIASEGAQRVRAAVELAQSILPVPVAPQQFDADPWLFNAANKTIDLRTGEARDPCRDDLITKASAVPYRADATCPAWRGFLSQIMGGKDDLVEFLRLAVGYSLTADVREKCFFFMYGSGDNGKSTLNEVLIELLGDYSTKMAADTILARNNMGGGIPNDIARLVGTRFVSTAELPEGRRLDEAKVKDLTGQDTVTARFMRAEFFDFRPVFKLWMYGNHKPVIRGADDGIWCRVRLIPFAVTIPKARQDRLLPGKLRAELPGILNWAVTGCLRWQREGLPMPRDIQEATAEYRTEMDVIGEFIRERCVVGTGADVRVGDLYQAYVAWIKDRGEYADSQPKFGARLKAKKFRQERLGKSSQWHWIGIALAGSHETNGHQANGHQANGDLPQNWYAGLDD